MLPNRTFKYLFLLSVVLTSSCSTIEPQTSTTPTAPAAPNVQAIQPERAAGIDNCSVGCPVGGSDVTLVRTAYTLNNDATTKFAKWVAYRITKDTPASNRPRNWKKDPDIAAGDTLDPPDYNGANEALKTDRGHQTNLASMGGVPDWEALNYLSNITPQKAELNQGAWARLEDQERNLVSRPGINAVYVATGPLYERYIGTLPGTTKKHTIPSGYWKIIFTNTTPTLTTFSAFIMDQDTPRAANFCTYQVTVEQIEQRTGLKLWSQLPPEDQGPLKSTVGQLAKQIGC
ncbi:DNA/RNA non-specific endonuclease [Pseudomonas gingeri]|uniref:DNA/RNA non-specific endonuclease n=1 Tax=Pseudomonas gingeri TaxID=117681 RepID=UPI0015A1891B|nr:DNA/RNA non-specific endonuclease [Pseudomonas gingeri]NWD71191.1 DNA/RNA non-specific endonuclease [Pseudomonas gingeri]